jgi:hypothetical protein
MDMTREDFLKLRQICAERGRELTPDELLIILQEVKDIQIVDRPGLVSEIKRLRHGDPGTG